MTSGARYGQKYRHRVNSPAYQPKGIGYGGLPLIQVSPARMPSTGQGCCSCGIGDAGPPGFPGTPGENGNSLLQIFGFIITNICPYILQSITLPSLFAYHFLSAILS